MKKSDVKTGNVYMAKITDGVVPVRLDQPNPIGGWAATNLATNKTVRIKSAAKLRRPATDRDIAAAERARIEKKAKKRASAKQDGARAKKGGGSKPKATKAKAATRAKSGDAAKSPKKRGVLDAAVEVLRDAKEPLNCRTMIDRIFERKLWDTSGQTPHATLYAAIIREIQNKGDEARFEKVDRGTFQLRKGVA